MQTSTLLDKKQEESNSKDRACIKQSEKPKDTKMPVIPFIIQFPKKKMNNSFIPVPNFMMKNSKKKNSNFKQTAMAPCYFVPSVNHQMQCTINKKSKMNGNLKKKGINVNQNFIMNNPMFMNADLNSSFYGFSKKSRVPFTPEEDEKIKELAEKYGSRQWPLIASFLPGRTPKQCRDRYSNYLVPGYFKGEWSKEEDELLTKLYVENGPKWSILQKSFPGRSSNSIKNRWNYFLCRQGKNDNETKSKISNDKYDQSDKNDDSMISSFLDQDDEISNESLMHEIGSISDVEKEENDGEFCYIDQENEMLEILNSNIIGYENEWSIFN